MSRLTFTILWLYTRPLWYVIKLCDKSRGLARRLSKSLYQLGERIPEPDYEPCTNEYKRAWDLLYIANDPEVAPYRPAVDGPLVRRALRVVSATVGALVALVALLWRLIR